jgi:hypothetical protein
MGNRLLREEAAKEEDKDEEQAKAAQFYRTWLLELRWLDVGLNDLNLSLPKYHNAELHMQAGIQERNQLCKRTAHIAFLFYSAHEFDYVRSHFCDKTDTEEALFTANLTAHQAYGLRYPKLAIRQEVLRFGQYVWNKTLLISNVFACVHPPDGRGGDGEVQEGEEAEDPNMRWMRMHGLLKQRLAELRVKDPNSGLSEWLSIAEPLSFDASTSDRVPSNNSNNNMARRRHIRS